MSERQSKAVQERHERMLNELAKKPENEHCADCGAKNPRWASYSLGIFLCIRCAGIHRKMGTHISKVKSITMDQWSIEQIEVMRNSGGNVVVNSNVNPNPGNHPLPITNDDEHVLERYIRAKWEKRAFMVDPTRQSMIQPPSTPKASPAVNRLQTLPKRSSSVPVINQNNLAKLQQLGDMRLKEDNHQFLTQTQGNLDLSTRITPPSVPQQQPVQFMSEEQKLDQLLKLGFLDRNSNLDALRRTGGNVDIAMTILNEAKNMAFAGQSQLLQQTTRSNSVSGLNNSNNNSFSMDTAISTSNTTVNAHNPFAQPQQPFLQLQSFQTQQQQPFQAQQQPFQSAQPFQVQQQPFQTQHPFQSGFPQQQVFTNPFSLSASAPSSGFPTNNTMSLFPQQQQHQSTSNPFSQMNSPSYLSSNVQPQQNPWSTTTPSHSLF